MQGREQLAGKKGPWILIPGLPSGTDLGQLIYFLPWRLFLESQGLNKNRPVSSESESTCLDCQSQCSSQAKLESTGPIIQPEVLFTVRGGFLCFPLLSPYPYVWTPKSSPALGTALPGKHGYKPHIIKKLFEQTGSEQPHPYIFQRVFCWFRF